MELPEKTSLFIIDIVTDKHTKMKAKAKAVVDFPLAEGYYDTYPVC